MDREHLCDSLVIWLDTLSLDVPAVSKQDLSDGVKMAYALHQIAPKFFNDAWLGKVKTDVSNNWRLKVSNMKKVLKGILDYYSEVLGQIIMDFHMPDVNAIGEDRDRVELGRLLQLILGCAVNCEDKQDYIRNIMSLEESVQHDVMNAIQELMTKETPAAGSDANSEATEQLKKTIEELNNVMEAKDEIAQRCHELDLQVVALQEERANLAAENERLNERVNQADSLEDPSTPAGRRYQQLQHQVESLQEDLYRLEAAKDEFRIKAEIQDKEILELQQKNEDLSILAEEARAMKDEIDVLKHTSDKVAKYEAIIESYKKKLEELSDLRGQVKMLEEKNTTYMQKNMELEEEIRKNQAMRSQLDVYKRQVQELQMKVGDETKRADKAEFENKRLQDKMMSVQQEKERLIAERDSLKETNEELTCTQVQKDSLLTESEGGMTMDGTLDMIAMPPEVKEKLIRLQHENKMLKLKRAASEDEQGQLLQSMLDDVNARKNELESEVRILNQRTMELEAQLEDYQENQQSVKDSTISESKTLRRKLAESVQRIQSLEADLSKKDTVIADLEPKLKKSQERIKKLEAALSKKEDEMYAMEERYKRYLEKAKSVIKTLDPKLSPKPVAELQTLRSQLQEKERFVEHLERDHEKAKLIREQEEKLMATAWHNLSMQLNRKATEERLTSSGAGQSFLARQRQAHTRRAQPSVAAAPITAPAR